jgi:hypothetical protein
MSLSNLTPHDWVVFFLLVAAAFFIGIRHEQRQP